MLHIPVLLAPLGFPPIDDTVHLSVIFEESPQFSYILKQCLVRGSETAKHMVELVVYPRGSHLFIFLLYPLIKTCRVILNKSLVMNSANIAFSNSDHIVFPS